MGREGTGIELACRGEVRVRGEETPLPMSAPHCEPARKTLVGTMAGSKYVRGSVLEEMEETGIRRKSDGGFKEAMKASNRRMVRRKGGWRMVCLGKKKIKWLCVRMEEAISRHAIKNGLSPMMEFIVSAWKLTTKDFPCWCCTAVKLQESKDEEGKDYPY